MLHSIRCCSLLLGLLLLLAAPVGAQPRGRLSQYPPRSRRFVTVVTYQGQQLLLQRTPDAKRPRRGRQAIGALETQLATVYRALPTNDTASVIRAAQSDSLVAALTLVQHYFPHWPTEVYTQEARFYERICQQRQGQRLVRQFAQGQQQLASLRASAQAWVATASFVQAAQAGRAAEQARHWAQAEIYLAHCLALRPTEAALRARHAAVSERCLWQYFTRWVRASQRMRWPGSAIQPLRHEPVYHAAQPLAAAYVERNGADYAALTLGGQPTYLYQAVENDALARELLVSYDIIDCDRQVEKLLQAYSQCYGYDSHWRFNRQQLQEKRELRSAHYD